MYIVMHCYHKFYNYCHMFDKYLLNFHTFYPTNNHHCISDIVLGQHNMNNLFNIFDIPLILNKIHMNTLHNFLNFHMNMQYNLYHYTNIRNIDFGKLHKQKDMLNMILLHYKLKLLINMWMLRDWESFQSNKWDT